MWKYSFSLILIFTVCLQVSAKSKLDYDRDIRPILSETCFACHGPDENTRQAEFRLDIANDHFITLLSPGNPAGSELVQRLLTEDQELKMPPVDSKKQLTTAQINLIRQWIHEGAKIEGHWAWSSPVKPEFPRIQNKRWAKNAIDYFIKDQLDEQKMKPASEANKLTLIRRVSLDVRGLPPSLEEMKAFLTDDSADAYETMVDRMLSSKNYGERMAQDWLDLSRYGDTNGYHADSHRDMWLYRDYVINAFNNNKPYDRFIIENVAGDLLAEADQETQIASGFNRNVTFNEEGGADPDEFYVAYAVDRANTTGQVFLGLTVGCAQCHDHKYDPISQKEYYQLYAFFNSVQDEIGAGGASGYHNKPLPPLLSVETDDYKNQLESLNKQTADLSIQLAQLTTKLKQDQALLEQSYAVWVKGFQGGKAGVDSFSEDLQLWLAADDINGDGVADAKQDFSPAGEITVWKDRSQHGRDAKSTGSPMFAATAVNGAPAVHLNGTTDYLRTDNGGENLHDDYTIISVISYDNLSANQMPIMWGAESQGKRRAMWKLADKQFLSFNGYGADVVGTKPIELNKPHIGVISQQQKNIRIYMNGEAGGEGTPGIISIHDLDPNPITIGANNAGNEKTYGYFAEVMIFNRVLTDTERTRVTRYLSGKYQIDSVNVAYPEDLLAISQKKRQQWSEEEAEKVFIFYLENEYLVGNPDVRKLKSELSELEGRANALKNALPTTMVMVQKPESNPAYILMRGDFQSPGEQVQPDVPSIFPRMSAAQPRNRLGLAHWLTDPEHPLVSRVVVNRLWKQLFGTGIVKTLGDLGTQGERPSHPALLDWLAVEFIDSGWNVKYLQKLMLMSATYQQDSQYTGLYDEMDPDNRLLSRASRFRLSAEEIRDNALAISGLLTEKIGGPSVRPYQPMDYYSDKIGRGWDQSRGVDLYRRGIYTYWQRTTVYPAFQIFDAPSREFCTVNRPRTNTPLQALVLMNDPTYVEAARVFSQRIIAEGGDSTESRFIFAFQTAVARTPDAQEMEVLHRLYQQQYEIYRQDQAAAMKIISVGESPVPEGLDQTEHAVWTALASIILNLDETVTRE
ncbi:MAG: hypothetical protein CMJ76_03905 [Planctomycetaceae bacterium]|nr:hypothetical protein [Planctomycetaceae bacterium]